MNATNSVDKLIHVLRAGDAIRRTYIGYIRTRSVRLLHIDRSIALQAKPVLSSVYHTPVMPCTDAHTRSYWLGSVVLYYLVLPHPLKPPIHVQTYVRCYMLARADQASFRWRRGGDELAQHGNASSPAFVTKTSHSSTLPSYLLAFLASAFFLLLFHS